MEVRPFEIRPSLPGGQSALCSKPVQEFANHPSVKDVSGKAELIEGLGRSSTFPHYLLSLCDIRVQGN